MSYNNPHDDTTRRRPGFTTDDAADEAGSYHSNLMLNHYAQDGDRNNPYRAQQQYQREQQQRIQQARYEQDQQLRQQRARREARRENVRPDNRGDQYFDRDNGPFYRPQQYHDAHGGKPQVDKGNPYGKDVRGLTPEVSTANTSMHYSPSPEKGKRPERHPNDFVFFDAYDGRPSSGYDDQPSSSSRQVPKGQDFLPSYQPPSRSHPGQKSPEPQLPRHVLNNSMYFPQDEEVYRNKYDPYRNESGELDYAALLHSSRRKKGGSPQQIPSWQHAAGYKRELTGKGVIPEFGWSTSRTSREVSDKGSKTVPVDNVEQNTFEDAVEYSAPSDDLNRRAHPQSRYMDGQELQLQQERWREEQRVKAEKAALLEARYSEDPHNDNGNAVAAGGVGASSKGFSYQSNAGAPGLRSTEQQRSIDLAAEHRRRERERQAQWEARQHAKVLPLRDAQAQEELYTRLLDISRTRNSERDAGNNAKSSQEDPGNRVEAVRGHLERIIAGELLEARTIGQLQELMTNLRSVNRDQVSGRSSKRSNAVSSANNTGYDSAKLYASDRDRYATDSQKLYASDSATAAPKSGNIDDVPYYATARAYDADSGEHRLVYGRENQVAKAGNPSYDYVNYAISHDQPLRHPDSGFYAQDGSAQLLPEPLHITGSTPNVQQLDEQEKRAETSQSKRRRQKKKRSKVQLLNVGAATLDDSLLDAEPLRMREQQQNEEDELSTQPARNSGAVLEVNEENDIAEENATCVMLRNLPNRFRPFAVMNLLFANHHIAADTEMQAHLKTAQEEGEEKRKLDRAREAVD